MNKKRLKKLALTLSLSIVTSINVFAENNTHSINNNLNETHSIVKKEVDETYGKITKHLTKVGNILNHETISEKQFNIAFNHMNKAQLIYEKMVTNINDCSKEEKQTILELGKYMTKIAEIIVKSVEYKLVPKT